MKTKFYLTCEITKDGNIYASCQLQYFNNKYQIIITENIDDLFVDFNLEINHNEIPEVVIKCFEVECLKRFTCDWEFTLAEIKENSGEEISFFNNI
jgi:hypothetical protein